MKKSTKEHIGKIITIILLLAIILIALLAREDEPLVSPIVEAYEAPTPTPTMTPTPTLTPTPTPTVVVGYEDRVERIRKFLIKKESILVDYAGVFVDKADEYDIDWRLVVAITGIESSFGKYNASPYNGYGWGGGSIEFSSWEESIDVVSRGLSVGYYKKGAKTIEEIAPIYCPPNYKRWIEVVSLFMEEI